jgi:DNA-directed RNA polymerase specialized sigma24 family protein
MARDFRKDPRLPGASAAVRQKTLEDPADFPRMALLVRAAQAGDIAAVDAIIAFLTPTVLHVIRALWGTQREDVETMTRDVLVSIVTALPTWDGECTLLHFATRIAARRAAAASPPAQGTVWHRLGMLGRGRWISPTPWEEQLAERRRALLRTFFGELPEDQGETLVLRLALGYSLREIALISKTPVTVVRNQLRLAKEALRARIEADPDWDELWGDDA